MAEYSGPERSCIGCRRKNRPSLMCRLALFDEGRRVAIDHKRSLPGRGAWLCRDEAGGIKASCFEAALRKKAFSRAFRADAGLDLSEILNAVHSDGNGDGRFGVNKQ